LCPLLVVDGGFWCGFCDAALRTPIPTIYDEENVIKECCITEATPIPTIYDEENVVKEYCITETTAGADPGFQVRGGI
jgi:hypothetical protein